LKDDRAADLEKGSAICFYVVWKLHIDLRRISQTYLREIPRCGNMEFMKRWLPDWRYGLLVVVLALLTLMVMDFNSRMAEWRRLTVRKEEVALQATQLAYTQASLETQIAYVTSPAGVRKWGYEQGKLVEEGDILIVPLPEGESTPAPTPAPTLAPQVVSNWQLWLSLFVDPSPH
jgi:hypothetical protein